MSIICTQPPIYKSGLRVSFGNDFALCSPHRPLKWFGELLRPRRIAAVGVATRVAEERGESVGGYVGYAVRLDARSSRSAWLVSFAGRAGQLVFSFAPPGSC